MSKIRRLLIDAFWMPSGCFLGVLTGGLERSVRMPKECPSSDLAIPSWDSQMLRDFNNTIFGSNPLWETLWSATILFGRRSQRRSQKRAQEESYSLIREFSGAKEPWENLDFGRYSIINDPPMISHFSITEDSSSPKNLRERRIFLGKTIVFWSSRVDRQK